MHKTCHAQIKAAGTEDGLAEGQFRALVSVFGNKDNQGDVVMPGAFKDSLADWSDSGDPIPMYWSHQMNDPDYNIGWVQEAKESEAGLEILGQLDLEDGTSSKAKQVYRLLKGRRVTQFSFAYDVLDGAQSEKDGDSFYELRKLKLYEVGPTPIGANPATELLGVKHADLAKSEDELTTALEAIAGGVAVIKNVLAHVAVSSDDEGKANTAQEKASDTGPATDKELPPEGATSKEPSRATPVSVLAAQIDLLEQEGTS